MLPLAAEAASIYFSPASGNYSVGRTFTINVNVSSADQAMNAVQGVVTFSPEQLSAVGISKSGSIVSLWVQEPSINNATGRINFEGVVLNPGFTGSAARVLQITFKAKAEGPATVSLASASVLANDGQGTNILSQIGNAKYLLEAEVIAPRLLPPEAKFVITLLDGRETNNPKPRVKLEVKNFKGLIDHYSIRADQGEFVQWFDDGSHIYQLPILDLGKHTITVRAYYNGEKFLEATDFFTILGLEKVTITEYPKQLSSGDTLAIRGKTYPNSKVTLWLQKDADQPVAYTASSDNTGEFTFVYEKLVSSGIYKFWAEVQDEKGAKSEPTDKLSVAVKESSIIRIGSTVISLITILVAFLGLLTTLLFAGFYSWHRFRMFKKGLDKEVSASEHEVRKVFKILKKDVDQQIEKLERAKSKRQLTEEEKGVHKVLMSHLEIAERFIEKEIEKVQETIHGDRRQE